MVRVRLRGGGYVEVDPLDPQQAESLKKKLQNPHFRQSVVVMELTDETGSPVAVVDPDVADHWFVGVVAEARLDLLNPGGAAQAEPVGECIGVERKGTRITVRRYFASGRIAVRIGEGGQDDSRRENCRAGD